MRHLLCKICSVLPRKLGLSMFSTTVSTGSTFEAKSLDMEHRSQRNDVLEVLSGVYFVINASGHFVP